MLTITNPLKYQLNKHEQRDSGLETSVGKKFAVYHGVITGPDPV